MKRKAIGQAGRRSSPGRPAATRYRAHGTVLREIVVGVIILGATGFGATAAFGEFYKYKDRNGNAYFVDEISKVPTEYLDQIKTYREKYDHLSGEERRRRERQEEEASRRREAERSEAFLRSIEIQREERAAYLEERNRKGKETAVTIRGNHVIVPVTVGYGNRAVQTDLILDTGATITVIHRRVADQLAISDTKKIKAQVANGQIVDSDLARVSYIEVGPHRKENLQAGVLDMANDRGFHSGLLGMNFLRGLRYHIDFDREVIEWE